MSQEELHHRTVEKVYTEKTPEDLRADFREAWKGSFRGSMPQPKEEQTVENATSTVEAYEVFVNVSDQNERRLYMQEFPLRAISAGFEIENSMVLPDVGELENGKKVTGITYILKSPNG